MMDLIHFVPLGAAVAMVALAVWLLKAGGGRETSRAFSIVLLARAASLVGLTMGAVAEAPEWIPIGGALYGGSAIIAGIGVLYFVSVYPVRWDRLPRGPTVQAMIFFAAVGLLVAVTLWPGLITPTVSPPTQAGPAAAARWFFAAPRRPLGMGPTLLDLLMAVAGFVLVRKYLAAAPGRGRDTLRLIALGFFVPASCSCMVAGLLLQLQGGVPRPANPSIFNWVEMAFFGAWAVVMAALIAYLVARSRKRTSDGDGPGAFIFVVIVSTLVGASTALISDLENRLGAIGAMLGFWSTLGAGLVAYGVLRYSLFDIDARVRVTVRRGTVAWVFVAVYTLVSEVSGEWFGGVAGSEYWGIAAATVLLLALHPIQGMAERLVERMMPTARPLRALDEPAQVAFYQEQVALLWMDGRLSPKDRRVLVSLRNHLGLDAETAEAVELEVIGAESETEPSPPGGP